MCGSHYQRWYHHGDPLGGGRARPRRSKPQKVCKVDGCTGKADRSAGGSGSRGYCGAHYQRLRKGRAMEPPVKPPKMSREGLCSVEGCPREKHGRGMCASHYHVARIGGDLSKPIKKIRKRWTGSIGPDGYHRGGRYGHHVLHQRAVMEDILGRQLRPEETVHHKNGVRSDNRPENLELWSTDHPAGQRVEDKLTWAHELIAQYEPEWIGGGC